MFAKLRPPNQITRPQTQRVRHPRECAFISEKEFGKIDLRFRDGLKVVDESGDPLKIKDLYTHLIVFGESGSGKTYYVLNQLYEELFRCTHLPDGPERENRKIGGLVIEAKGDFTQKTWHLAQKYGRMEDILFFGPTHLDNRYNMFGDASESPMQLADKMMQLLSAFGGGAKSQDPFWDNAARKLFTHLFLLHRVLRQHEVNDLPALSFELVNLMIMDRGAARNQGAIEADRAAWTKTYETFQTELDRLRTLSLEIALESQALRDPLGLASRFLQLQEAAGGILNSTTDEARGVHYQAFLEEESYLVPRLREHLSTPNSLSSLAKNFLPLIDHLQRAREWGERILDWKPLTPSVGVLRKMVTQYEELLQAQDREPEQDSICAYFNEEYLNLVNDKTSGSVGMVASNLVTLFVHPPFNQIFCSEPTFSMTQVIDQGKIVVLDMPLALYGAPATVAALVLKIDFFRAMLSRSRLRISTSEASPPALGQSRPINQDRPMTYFCDEFASIASTGETTGEAGFLDKVREYKCACILGLQSIPMLQKKFSEAEVNAILTNCGNKIFLRNSDPKTTEIAAKVFGTIFKSNLNRGHTALEMAMNGDMPVGKESFSSSYVRGNRIEPTDFAQLKDGVAHVRLNPRFGRKQLFKGAFCGSPIGPLDKHDHFPLPESPNRLS